MATMTVTPDDTLSGQNAAKPAVWAIDSTTADRYGLVTITKKTSMGTFSAVPCVIVSGTHQVREWRVWAEMTKPDGSVRMENVGFVQIDPNSPRDAYWFRVRYSVHSPWSDAYLHGLRGACYFLMWSAKMGRKLTNDAED